MNLTKLTKITNTSHVRQIALFRAYQCSDSKQITNNMHCTINCQILLCGITVLSARAAKTGPSIVLRLKVNIHVWPINESDNIYNNVHCTSKMSKTTRNKFISKSKVGFTQHNFCLTSRCHKYWAKLFICLVLR